MFRCSALSFRDPPETVTFLGDSPPLPAIPAQWPPTRHFVPSREEPLNSSWNWSCQVPGMLGEGAERELSIGSAARAWGAASAQTTALTRGRTQGIPKAGI